MGTRHLIAVVNDGEYKIAQYGQWDGYPSGQGLVVLDFLHNFDRDLFEQKLGKCRFFDETDQEFLDEYDANCPQWSNEPDNRTPEQLKWNKYLVSRDIWADILTNVVEYEGDEILLKNSVDFALDSLFCEYAYVVDLDKNVLEVYEGFQKSEVVGRFSDPDKFIKEDHRSEQYSPVTLVQSYDLEDLPTHEKFLSDLEQDEE